MIKNVLKRPIADISVPAKLSDGGLTEMVGGLLLLAVSLVVVAFAGINLRNCISRGAATAYGHVYSREGNPAAFWLSAACSVAAILIGVMLALATTAGLLGLV